MKSYFLLVASIVLLTCIPAAAQIGLNNTSPDPSAVLDLAATDKGLLIPRMTSAQRQAIASPAASLLVYDTDDKRYYFYNAGQWFALNEWERAAGSNHLTHTGDVTVTGTITATNYGGINVSGTVPAGGIIMWSGAINAIPTGWALCDGANGTPDLRNRFIVGAGSSYSAGATGGEASVQINSNHLPPHTHTMSSTGAHTHTVPIRTSQDVNGGTTHVGGASNVDMSTVTTSSAGSHSHIINPNVTTHQQLENRPPYYALAYIMKRP